MQIEGNSKKLGQWDVLIKGASICDGTGRPAYEADLAILGDRIVAVGQDLEGIAEQTIVGKGLVLAPGFIDVHSHDDFAVFSQPDVSFKTMQGVTTAIVGNCGDGCAPYPQAEILFRALDMKVNTLHWHSFEDYFQLLDEHPPGLNVAVLVGHGTIRAAVMGSAMRAPDKKELHAMKDLINEGMSAGAVGFSTGLIYEPSSFAKTDEVIELVKEVKKYSGVYTTHIRNEAANLVSAVQEALTISEKAHVGLQLSHHKAAGRSNWGKVKESLALVDEAKQRGIAVSLDQYPYTSGSTNLSAVVKNGSLEESEAHKSGLGFIAAEDVLLASVPHLPQYEGKTLAFVCEELKLKPTLAAKKLLEKADVVVVLNIMCEKDVRTVMHYPSTMFGSDGVPSDSGRPHPRLYGTFARVLGHYCREQKIFSLEEAIYRMTAMPAAKFNLKQRGVIHPGMFADLVLFDFNQINDVATYENPRQHPTGIKYVFVNGKAVVANGVHTKQRSGKALRL